MGTRWFGMQSGPDRTVRSTANGRGSGEPRAVLLHDAITAWRAWLTSGARRVPVDRRRARGAETILKKTLMGGPSGPVDFSSAMARQAIDVAMNELPTQHRQVVKLAYFGGLTNLQIAQQLGLTVGGVRRRLHQSLVVVSASVERGRATGRRAVHSLAIWLAWRRFGDGPQRLHGPAVEHFLQVGMVAVMTIAASALLVSHQTPAGSAPQTYDSRVATAATAPSRPARVERIATSTVAMPAARGPMAPAVGRVATVQALDVKAPVPSLPVTLPALPAIPASPLKSVLH